MFTVMASMLCVAIQVEPGPSPFSHLNMPIHGTLYKQSIFGFFAENSPDRSNLDLLLIGIPIDKPTKNSWKRINMGLVGGGYTFRHHIRDRILWFTCDDAGMIRIPFDDLHLVDPANEKRDDQFKKKYSAPGTSYTSPFGWGSPALYEKYFRLRFREGSTPASAQGPPKGVAGIDFVPISPTSSKIFYFPKKDKKIETWETEIRFNAKKQHWDIATDQRNPESIDSLFVEDFYAFIRTDDYYFVTQSGKLYVAPARKNGKEARTMKAVWDDAKLPIAAVIEDADNDKVWLFTKAKNKLDTKGVFFEMATELHKQPFDHAKLAKVDVEGRARPLLEYLPLIRDKAKKQPKE